MLEHRDPLDAHPEREALVALGVVATLAHVLEHVRVDLPGAEDLDPALALAQRAARAVGHEAVAAVEAGDVDLDARLGEREEVRAQAHPALLAEDRAGEGEQRALEVAERDVLVDRQPFDLVELRRVGGVVVAPVAAAGDDDVERRRVLLHRPDLHRRGVRAQHHVVGRVERVGLQPRRVLRAVVERVEVVVDEVGLRPLHDAEAEAEEHVLDLAPRGGQQVQAPGGRRGRAGERDVDHVGGQPGVELGRLERVRARLDRRLERAPGLVGGAADLPALGRVELGDPAQQVRQLGLAPEEAHAHLLELGGARRAGDGGLALGPQLADPLGHRPRILRPTS